MSENEIITIRTLECDVCDRYDSIMLSQEEVIARSNSTDMGIGAYSVVHKDHTRIIYFDKDGTYLGDTIAMNPDDIPEIFKEKSKLVPCCPNCESDNTYIQETIHRNNTHTKKLCCEDCKYWEDYNSKNPEVLKKELDSPRKRGKIITFFTQRFSTKQ